MYLLRQLTYSFLVLCLLIFVIWAVPRAVNPSPPSPEQAQRDRAWVSTSPYWIDRQLCRWFSLCGLAHIRWDPPALSDHSDDIGELHTIELRSLWKAPSTKPQETWTRAGREKREARRGRAQGLQNVPDYVLAHAPLVHLYSGENFWPADIAEHVQHMKPFANGTALNVSSPLDLNNLHELSGINGLVFLTSKDDVEGRPEWLHSHVGTPDEFANTHNGTFESPKPDSQGAPKHSDGSTWYDVDKDHPIRRISDPRRLGDHDRKSHLPRRPSRMRRNVFADPDLQRPLADDDDAAATVVSSEAPSSGEKPDSDGYSKAPAVLVMVDKGSGILDAFWFFFYSYNLGQTVLDLRFGNHVGDWEHCMVRFENGVPRALFFSEHEGGQAYAWSALEKYRPRSENGTELPERPIVYSAVGSHAMYALPGRHPYVLPFKMLKDVTDAGPIWDPAKNNYAFHYDYLLDEQEQRDAEGGVVRNPTSLQPASSNPDLATSWFHFDGPWGDELYSLGDPRQWRLFGQYHYVTGPMGPKFKNLDREKVCQTQRCRILYDLEAGKKGTWYS